MPIRMIADPVNPNTKYEILETRILYFRDSRFYDSRQGRRDKSRIVRDTALSHDFAKQLLRDKKIDKYLEYDIATNNGAFNLALNTLPDARSCKVKLKSGKTSFVINCQILTIYRLLNPLDSITPMLDWKSSGDGSGIFIDYSGVYVFQIILKKVGTVSKLLISTFPSNENDFPSHIIYNWRQYIFYKNNLDSIIRFAIKNGRIQNYIPTLLAPFSYINAWISNCNRSTDYLTFT